MELCSQNDEFGKANYIVFEYLGGEGGREGGLSHNLKQCRDNDVSFDEDTRIYFDISRGRGGGEDFLITSNSVEIMLVLMGTIVYILIYLGGERGTFS